MTRRAGKHKPSIGDGTGAGIGYNPDKGLKGNSLTAGNRGGAVESNPQTRVPGFDGSVLTTWPTYEPLYTGRPHIVQFEPTQLSFASMNIVATFPQSAALIADSNNDFAILTDNLARAYANAQNLQLVTPADFSAYITNWGRAFSIYYGLISILNGDGFNDRMTQLAQTMSSNRSRIQSGYERLQSIPGVPGFTDVLMRIFGCFADYVGGDVIINMCNNTNANGTPTDLTVAAGVTTLLAQAELELSTMQTSSENGVIRIVLEEYFGANAPLPWHGVKVHRGLYDQFHCKAVHNWAATNSFLWPYVFNGSLGTTPGIVPITIPKGCEGDSWWQTLMRYQPWGAYNNVVRANQFFCGMVSDFLSASSILRYYPQNIATTGVATIAAGLNGYADPWNDFVWAPPPANSDGVGYGADLRVQRDWTVVTASFDYIVQQTMELRRDILAGKRRLPLPPGLTDWNATRLQGRNRPTINLS